MVSSYNLAMVSSYNLVIIANKRRDLLVKHGLKSASTVVGLVLVILLGVLATSDVESSSYTSANAAGTKLPFLLGFLPGRSPVPLPTHSAPC